MNTLVYNDLSITNSIRNSVKVNMNLSVRVLARALYGIFAFNFADLGFFGDQSDQFHNRMI
ncbi:MAG: hypothetical protein N4A40_14355 [Tissierellales bacterium]|jgi:hypothetical protein|nr:hypothetical protein [Tissierellales bacterium]